jgi:hypothetical protein
MEDPDLLCSSPCFSNERALTALKGGPVDKKGDGQFAATGDI